MLGKMQDWPLRLTRVLDHAANVHSRREIVTYEADGSVNRSNWFNVARDARKFARYLEANAIKPGDLKASNSWERIISDDADSAMPPTDFKKQLTEKQKEIIKKWIE